MTDLDEMLRTLTVSIRPRHYTFATVTTTPQLGDGIDAVLAEAEGVTVVATTERATVEGWPVDYEAAWLTLEVHSALDAVGLTDPRQAYIGWHAQHF